jgi:hypothetical protein
LETPTLDAISTRFGRVCAGCEPDEIALRALLGYATNEIRKFAAEGVV